MKIARALPELPYDKNALNPIITEETFDHHHGKHHASYVNDLYGLEKDTGSFDLSVEEIIRKGHTENNAALFNNAVQHWNHSFFRHCLSPNGGKVPEGKIGELIVRDFANKNLKI